MPCITKGRFIPSVHGSVGSLSQLPWVVRWPERQTRPSALRHGFRHVGTRARHGKVQLSVCLFDWHSKTATAVLLLIICSAGHNTVACPPGGRRGRRRQRSAGPRAAPPPAPPPRSRPGAALGAARRCTRSAAGASAARRQRRRRARRAPGAAARAHLCPASARGLSSHGLVKCTKESQGAVQRKRGWYMQLVACLRGQPSARRAQALAIAPCICALKAMNCSSDCRCCIII